jgi:signal transduction histidine kinase
MADLGAERRAREQSEVKADTERREHRESQERADLKAETERRERRESLERSDLQADTGRRERRESAERKDRQQAQLLQAQRLESLGQLAGGVAHDFNNLLAVILSYASFVTEELASPTGPDWPEKEAARSDLRQITLAAERATGLTRQLLTFARREVVRPQVLDLGHVITGVQELLHRTLGEHIELITTLGGDLWPILADPGQLEQVLVNLAVNARDAMPGGGTLTIDTSNITVDADAVAGGSPAPPGKNVRLRISDTAPAYPQKSSSTSSSRSSPPRKTARAPGSAWPPSTASWPRPEARSRSTPSRAPARPSASPCRSPRKHWSR